MKHVPCSSREAQRHLDHIVACEIGWQQQHIPKAAREKHIPRQSKPDQVKLLETIADWSGLSDEMDGRIITESYGHKVERDTVRSQEGV